MLHKLELILGFDQNEESFQNIQLDLFERIHPILLGRERLFILIEWGVGLEEINCDMQEVCKILSDIPILQGNALQRTNSTELD